MHYFHNLSPASRSFAPRLSPGLHPCTPLGNFRPRPIIFPTLEKILRAPMSVCITYLECKRCPVDQCCFSVSEAAVDWQHLDNARVIADSSRVTCLQQLAKSRHDVSSLFSFKSRDWLITRRDVVVKRILSLSGQPRTRACANGEWSTAVLVATKPTRGLS